MSTPCARHRSRTRRPALRRRVLRVVRRRRLRRPAPRRRARGPGRPPEHADHRRRGAARGGPADRDAAAQPAQLRDARSRPRRPGSSRPSHGRPVLEFGMRRAAAEGADAASRAAIVGGAVSTSNSAVAYELGLTPAGTHAHSMVQLFIALGERRGGRLRRLRRRLPGRHAAARRHRRHARQRHPQRHRHVRAAAPARPRAGRHPPRLRRPRLPRRAGGARARRRRLPRHGHRAVEPARRADDLADHGPDRRPRPAGPASTPTPSIGRLVIGVGSRLATSHGDPSLDGVFKLVAVDDGAARGAGDQALGLAGQGAQPRRQAAVAALRRARAWRPPTCCRRADEALAPGSLHLHHHARPDVVAHRRRRAPSTSCSCPSSTAAPIVADGGAEALGDLAAAAARRVADLERFDPGVRRLVNPHEYHVSITDDRLTTSSAGCWPGSDAAPVRRQPPAERGAGRRRRRRRAPRAPGDGRGRSRRARWPGCPWRRGRSPRPPSARRRRARVCTVSVSHAARKGAWAPSGESASTT